MPQCRWCSTPAPAWRCTHCNGVRLRRGRHRGAAHGRGAGPRLPGQAGHHVLRRPGQGHRSGLEGPGGGHGRRRTGRRRRLRCGAAARRRLAAAPGKPAGGGGRRPALVQRRGPGPPRGATAAWWSSPRTTPPAWAPCCAGTRPATPSGNWPCGQELQLPPSVRVASITGGRTAVGHFTEAVEQQLAAQDIVLRTAGPAPLCWPVRPARRMPGQRSGCRRGGCPDAAVHPLRPGRATSPGAAGGQGRRGRQTHRRSGAAAARRCGRPLRGSRPRQCRDRGNLRIRRCEPATPQLTGDLGAEGVRAPATSGPARSPYPGGVRAAPRLLRRRPPAGGRTRPS